MGVIHRFLERACNYRRDLNSSEVLLALRDVDLREGRHVGPFPRGGPLASFQGNIPDLMNDTCEDLSVIPPNPKGNEVWSRFSSDVVSNSTRVFLISERLMRSLKMLWGTGNPHTSCIILGNAVNTRDNNLFDKWEMKTHYTCQSFFCFCS